MNVEELLPAYVAGELSGPEREQVEAVLEDSPRLREEARRYERLFVFLVTAAAEEAEVPAGFEERVARQVAVRAYLGAAARVAEGLLGAYGRAIIYYLKLI